MYRQDKKQTKKILEVLYQANEEIKNTITKKQYESTLDLLEQCQEVAIELGTFIEEKEGEGFVTVCYIETFCETIFQIHASILQTGRADAISTHKKISKSLDKIEQSIQTDISSKRIAIFMPYKASMWGSLESVWIAADEDPDCEAIVMPIPYYEKNPDGTLGEMHYEGHQYPGNVPITDYQNYDFSKKRPDMIFIHNPYDEKNHVTTVHPFFYSSKLKDLTDQLIYIPYFVLAEINPGNRAARSGMEHFCIAPAVIYAHHTIVQSEAMRQVYINALCDTFGEESRDLWEQKIRGIGSPKFDSVKNYCANQLTIPEAWDKIILKPDGSKKKVIFYNTGLVAMLEHKEAMVEKITRALRIFKENQDEIALLWRPHPLYQETLSSMHPELWNAYCEVVKKYQEEGWGIYDDTPNLERAIALSDAYYGDGSSIVQLFKEVKKPVMIQSVWV